MHKLWLMIKREYLVRVRKKTFLLFTLLTPIAFGILTFGMGFASAYMSEKSAKNVLVSDESGIFKKYAASNTSILYTLSDSQVDTMINNYHKLGYDLLAIIPKEAGKGKKMEVKYYSQTNPGIITIEKIEGDLSEAFKKYKSEKFNFNKAMLDSLEVNVNMVNAAASDSKIDKDGKLNLMVATALSFVMGFILYMVIFIFGSQVMRSVMEEKMNRIVEVMISSVKPFQLMMAKVIGVGAVGLTQLFIWIIVIPVIMMVATAIFGPAPETNMPGIQTQINPENFEGFQLQNAISVFFSLNWWVILPSFILFFIGGFFLYSSLFAAVGSAIGDDQGESQSLIWPITIPVLIGFIIMTNTVQNPNSPIAVFGSLFPLFSPLVMPARLPFNPPIWQVAISLVLLLLTCWMFIWISAKIYRGGILLYGKKLSMKDMWKLLINKY